MRYAVRLCGMVLLSILLMTVLATSEGCVKRVPLTPAQTITLSLNQTVGTIAALNRTMIADTIAINKAGFLNDATTKEILLYNREINRVLKLVSAIQKGATTDAEKAAAIKAAFAVLKLPPDVSTLLTSTQVDASVVAVQATISSLQSLIANVSGGAK